MKYKRKYNTPVFVLILLMILTFLFVKSGLLETGEYRLIKSALYQLDNLNEKLDYEVLKIRTGVLRHYNSLDSSLLEMLRLTEIIQNKSQQTKNSELIDITIKIRKELDKKEESINHLKSDNGVLRNSLMYFSILNEEILSEYRRSEVKASGLENYVLDDMPVLNSRVIKVVRNPTVSVLDEVTALIDSKTNKIKNLHDFPFKLKMLLVLRHADVIVDHTREVNAAIVNIVESDIVSLIDQSGHIIASLQAKELEQQSYFRLILFLVSLALTVYVGYVVYQLRVASNKLKKNVIDMRYQKMATDKHAVICVVNKEGVIQEVNHNYLQVFGYEKEDVLFKRGEEIHALKNDNGDDIATITSSGKLWKGIVEEKDKQGKKIWFELTVVPFINDEKQIYKKIYIGTDITDRKEAEEQIEYLAYHDDLTGLPNRRLLVDRLEQAVKLCQIHKHYGAIIYIDVDLFKRVNESLGHDAGDFLLIEMASRLVATMPDATIARLGDDEFVVLISEVADDIDYGNFVVQRAISKIQASLNEKYNWKDNDLHITPSLGVTLFPIEVTDPQQIIKQADTALQRAKESGKGQYRFFHPRMQEAVESRLYLENDLRKSFEKNQLHLNLQPQYNVNGSITGAEILIRWRHARRGNVSPGVFIPLAEETGLILPIGRWVIEQACILIRHWDELFEGNIPFDHLAVNVSVLQFSQPDFVDMIKEIIAKTEARPEFLELEITEGMLINDVDATIKKITQLRDMGIRFSVDDFGTGYSSLMYLSKLPIEQLKIDKGFVRNIETDKYNAAIVETIIAMAKHLNMEVIAEGVETEAELECLKKMQCTNFQGYYYSRPLELHTFNDLLNGIYKSQQQLSD